MAKFKKGTYSEITVGAFSGLDCRTVKEGSVCDASYMRNFRITGDGALEKRPGYKKLLSDLEYESWYLGPVRDRELFVYKNDTVLYALDPMTGEAVDSYDAGVYDDVGFFLFGGYLYAFGGDCLVKFDGDAFSEPDIYVPTVAVTALPTGGGTVHESLNLLSEFAKISYSPDGESTVYTLPEFASEVIAVTENGTTVDSGEYSYSADSNTVTFASPPAGGVPDSLVITFMLADGYVFNRKRFGKCFCVYGGDFDSRVFIYGVGNRIYYTDVTDTGPDVTYVPAENFITVGDGTYDVTALLRHYDRLLVFTERETWFVSPSSVDYDGYSKPTFPVYPLNGKLGSENGAVALANNYPVTLTLGGLYRFSATTIRDERAVECISDKIEGLLDREFTENALLFDLEEKKELWCANGGTVYVYNYALDAFYCYDGIEAEGFAALGGEAAFVNGGAVYVFDPDVYTDDGNGYAAVWESRFFLPAKKYRKCILRRISVSTLPVANNRLTLRIIPNRGREMASEREIASSVFDFSGTDFSNFSFDTERKPTGNRFRLRSDAFEYIRIRLENSKTNSRCGIRGLDMKLEIL